MFGKARKFFTDQTRKPKPPVVRLAGVRTEQSGEMALQQLKYLSARWHGVPPRGEAEYWERNYKNDRLICFFSPQELINGINKENSAFFNDDKAAPYIALALSVLCKRSMRVPGASNPAAGECVFLDRSGPYLKIFTQEGKKEQVMNYYRTFLGQSPSA